MDDARARGFHLLHDYIGGANADKKRIPMMAPVQVSFPDDVGARPGPAVAAVVAEPEPETDDDACCCWLLSSSSTVATGSATLLSKDFVTVQEAFFLPAELHAPPKPTSAELQVIAMPEMYLAAITYSGSWALERAHAVRAELVTKLRATRWVRVAEPVQMLYNAPWVPSFLRRNEVGVQVDGECAQERRRSF